MIIINLSEPFTVDLWSLWADSPWPSELGAARGPRAGRDWAPEMIVLRNLRGLGFLRPICLRMHMRCPVFKQNFSVDGAESEEDAHEIMFYSLRKPATVTLKEMYAFGASTKNSTRTLLLAAQVGV
jgi:hypothetical protein